MKNLLIITTLFASFLVLSSCATMSLIETAKSKSSKKYEKNVLSEKVIALGYPSTPIKNYENAMLLAGENYSFLVQPKVSSNTPNDLFKVVFKKVDLGFLYIDPKPKSSRIEPMKHTIYDTLELDVESDDSKKIKQLPVDIGLLFAKPVNLLKANEQRQMEQLGFECKILGTKEKEDLICQHVVPTVFTLASAVQNIDDVDYKLKRSLTIDLNYQGETEGNSREWLRIFTPVTIAVDIVTSPVQLLGAGLAVGAIAAAYSQCDSSCI